MQQSLKKVSNEMMDRLEIQRKWVKDHYIDNVEENYKSLPGKLDLLDKIIRSNWIEKHETYKLQCLGVVFGDALIQELGFHWIEVEDEFGIDPAIRWNKSSLICYPLTMISKRIENGENVDVYKLFKKSKSELLELKKKAD